MRRKESDNENEDDDDKQNLYSSGNESTTVSVLVLNLAQPVLFFPSPYHAIVSPHTVLDGFNTMIYEC